MRSRKATFEKNCWTFLNCGLGFFYKPYTSICVKNPDKGAIFITYYRDEKPYEKMTKAELIEVIEELKNQLEYLEDSIEETESSYSELNEESEHMRRSLSDYRQKEKEEVLYNLFPNMKPLWWKKD
ncbi:hypothetical protein [Bacillus sp. 7884-1]|uniref:hypothetical protein n=1 Tax=Bacillus sp. 7884-1 TaxID=2021693 RepID=UPI000BA70952|nr:hypothetical protein [Bacillus sp. 7884-1]PAE33339.1 hypothetical protein CHI06_26155 [Bacillus sp. 7884-1]